MLDRDALIFVLYIQIIFGARKFNLRRLYIMNEIIDIETLFSDKKYCCNLGNIILNVKFNIADCIEEAFNETLFATNIPANTFEGTVNRLVEGIPHFQGVSKSVSPLYYLANRMFSIVNSYFYKCQISIKDKDLIIIKAYIVMFAQYLLTSMDIELLKKAKFQQGRGSHKVREKYTKMAVLDLCKKFEVDTIGSAMCIIKNNKLCKYDYKIKAISCGNNTFSFQVSYWVSESTEFKLEKPLIIYY